MARTAAGAQLTVQHRQQQVALRARALRDYMTLWPLWQPGDASTFGRLVDATIPLARAHHRTSAGIAAGYYDSFRRAERVAGRAAPRLPGPLDVDRLVASLHVTGEVAVRKSVLAGKSPQAAQQTAQVTTSQALTRHILAGGRSMLVLSTGTDSQAVGWARITGGNPCQFCQMLASRGAVYRGEDTAEFQAHDGCACMAELSYEA